MNTTLKGLYTIHMNTSYFKFSP